MEQKQKLVTHLQEILEKYGMNIKEFEFEMEKIWNDSTPCQNVVTNKTELGIYLARIFKMLQVLWSKIQKN